ncbi:hypothetical protein [Sulfuricurvum sp.]|uniref:hypothetical protein n=1 Tax=Sulfuricurvum sp. TaxID=2025608 RepID=UPI002636380B|nr:hypothetical protein [Sulfuricurvum sp.]MDD4949631.1 hypothetical protein [Sulfuricurvum sp.]
MSKDTLHLDSIKDEAREYSKLTRTHLYKLAFTVIKRDEVLGGIKKDRETKLPMVDEHGEDVRYPSKYKIVGAYNGGQMSFYVTKDQYDQIKFNELYLGTGFITTVIEFGVPTLMPEFSTIEEI